MWPNGTETMNQAYARDVATIGTPQTVRVFYPGLPLPWSGWVRPLTQPLAMSFNALPATILSGADDAALAAWFDGAPTNRTIWWSYNHEPEHHIELGQYTAAAYRAAWAHIAAIADASGHANLRATLTLMNWTANPASGRTVADYYAGPNVIDTIAWDAYNSPTAQTAGVYDSPASVFGQSYNATVALGRSFAVGEFGSLLATGDTTGAGRAAWIAASGQWLAAHNASFADYFDANMGGNYQLFDTPSQRALGSLFG